MKVHEASQSSLTGVQKRVLLDVLFQLDFHQARLGPRLVLEMA